MARKKIKTDPWLDKIDPTQNQRQVQIQRDFYIWDAQQKRPINSQINDPQINFYVAELLIEHLLPQRFTKSELRSIQPVNQETMNRMRGKRGIRLDSAFKIGNTLIPIEFQTTKHYNFADLLEFKYTTIVSASKQASEEISDENPLPKVLFIAITYESQFPQDSYQAFDTYTLYSYTTIDRPQAFGIGGKLTKKDSPIFAVISLKRFNQFFKQFPANSQPLENIFVLLKQMHDFNQDPYSIKSPLIIDHFHSQIIMILYNHMPLTKDICHQIDDYMRQFRYDTETRAKALYSDIYMANNLNPESQNSSSSSSKYTFKILKPHEVILIQQNKEKTLFELEALILKNRNQVTCELKYLDEETVDEDYSLKQDSESEEEENDEINF